MFSWLKARAQARAALLEEQAQQQGQQARLAKQEQAQQVQLERQQALLALALVAVNRAQLRQARQAAQSLLVDPRAVQLALLGRREQLLQARMTGSPKSTASSGKTARRSTSRRRRAR